MCRDNVRKMQVRLFIISFVCELYVKELNKTSLSIQDVSETRDYINIVSVSWSVVPISTWCILCRSNIRHFLNIDHRLVGCTGFGQENLIDMSMCGSCFRFLGKFNCIGLLKDSLINFLKFIIL